MSDIENPEIYDFHREEFFKELTFGKSILKWMYESRSGKILGQLLTREIPCYFYGKYKSTNASKKAILPFIEQYDIDLCEYPDIDSYISFNDFFKRKFVSGVRNFSKRTIDFPAFCEARYLVYNSVEDIPVKGSVIDPLKLLGGNRADYRNGQIIVARLAPVDYHRFHFPDDGFVKEQYKIGGLLNSVSPIAIKNRSDVLVTNKRFISLLELENFGEIAYIDIGAFCVGTIEQTHKEEQFTKGQEKGYFLFGGSTVVIITKSKIIDFDSKILEHSKKNIETFIKLGTTIGQKIV